MIEIRESMEVSALSLLPTEYREWLPGKDDEGWYGLKMTDVVKRQTARVLSPIFQAVPAGTTMAYTCSLYWRKGNCRVHLVSPACVSTLLALDSVLELLQTIPVEIPNRNWVSLAADRLAFRSMRVPVFRNVVQVGVPSFECTLAWGPANDLREVISSGKRSRDEAFEAAIQLALRKGEVPRQPPNRNKNDTVLAQKPAAPKMDSHRKAAASHALDVNSVRLLSEAKQRWQIERQWLMGLTGVTHIQNMRLHRLSTFLVLLDPLRRLELERSQTQVAMGSLAEELLRIANDINPEVQQVRRAEHLRLLIGRSTASVGDEVAITVTFESKLRSSGLSCPDVIADLVANRLLRRTLDGQLSVSVVGVNLMESAVTKSIGAGTIGAALPPGVLQLMVELRDDLSTLV